MSAYAFATARPSCPSVREIAAEAGVNAALINRYFGSKMGLFTEVVGDSFTIGDLLVGDRGTLGERLAGYLLRPRLCPSLFAWKEQSE